MGVSNHLNRKIVVIERLLGLAAAYRLEEKMQLLSSQHRLMNLLMGITTTLQNTAFAVASIVPNWMYSQKGNREGRQSNSLLWIIKTKLIGSFQGNWWWI